jgi:hypothetical protein
VEHCPRKRLDHVRDAIQLKPYSIRMAAPTQNQALSALPLRHRDVPKTPPNLPSMPPAPETQVLVHSVEGGVRPGVLGYAPSPHEPVAKLLYGNGLRPVAPKGSVARSFGRAHHVPQQSNFSAQLSDFRRSFASRG